MNILSVLGTCERTSGLNDTLKGTALVEGDITLTAKIKDVCEKFKTQIKLGELAGVSNFKVGDNVKIATKDGIVCGKVVHITEDEVFVDYEDRKTMLRPEFVILYNSSNVCCAEWHMMVCGWKEVKCLLHKSLIMVTS